LVSVLFNMNEKGKIMNILERIFQAIDTDCCSTEKESNYLKAYYENATKEQKEAIDQTLIAICGWSFKRLLEME